MGDDERQDAVLVDLAQRVAAQVAQLLFSHHLESAVDERCVRVGRLDRDFAIDQQIKPGKLLYEGVRSLRRKFEFLAELEDVVGRLGGLAVLEQGRAVGVVTDHIAAGIKAERELFRIRLQPRQHERIAPHKGGDIGLPSQPAFFIDENVHILVEAHQRERHRRIADRKDNRIEALRDDEFIRRERDCMSLREERRRVARSRLQIAMRAARERLELMIKEGQVGRRGRHDRLRNNVRGLLNGFSMTRMEALQAAQACPGSSAPAGR